MGIGPQAADRIRAGLADIEVHLSELEQLGPVTARELDDDWQRRRLFEWCLFLVCQGVLTTAAVMSGALRLPEPATYRDLVVGLGDAGVLDLDLAERLAPLAGFRNVLAHDYVDFDADRMLEALDRLDDVRAFVVAVAVWSRR